VNRSALVHHDPERGAETVAQSVTPSSPSPPQAFRDAFIRTFQDHYPRLLRYLDRLSGDPELAADLAQDTFMRLYRRNALPDKPEAWLITVALNLYRNARSTVSRRSRLLSVARALRVHSDAPAPPAQPADASRQRVRRALDALSQRDRNLLLLRAEGYSYHDIASALGLNEASIGTWLARARQAFSEALEVSDAS
jgi:RNA polymerase sigma-70 factor (ECF subfamily)